MFREIVQDPPPRILLSITVRLGLASPEEFKLWKKEFSYWYTLRIVSYIIICLKKYAVPKIEILTIKWDVGPLKGKCWPLWCIRHVHHTCNSRQKLYMIEINATLSNNEICIAGEWNTPDTWLKKNIDIYNKTFTDWFLEQNAFCQMVKWNFCLQSSCIR